MYSDKNFSDKNDFEVETFESESPARMSQEELLDFFDSLTPKEEILVWYNSGIRRGDDWTPMTVGRRSESKKYNLKKISLTGKQGGKFTLYNRQGKISLAMGDMATVLISAKKNGSFGAEIFGSERQELCIWGCGSKVYKKGEPCYSCKYGAETFNAQYDFDKSFDPKGDEHKCWYDDHQWVCYDIDARNDNSTFDITLMCEECGMKVVVGGAVGILTEKGKGAETFDAEIISKPKEVILKEKCGLCGDTLILVDDGLGQKYKTCLGESCGYVLPMSAETFEQKIPPFTDNDMWWGGSKNVYPLIEKFSYSAFLTPIKNGKPLRESGSPATIPEEYYNINYHSAKKIQMKWKEILKLTKNDNLVNLNESLYYFPTMKQAFKKLPKDTDMEIAIVNKYIPCRITFNYEGQDWYYSQNPYLESWEQDEVRELQRKMRDGTFEAKGIDTLAKPFEEIGIPKTYARLGVITAGITALAFGVIKLKDR